MSAKPYRLDDLLYLMSRLRHPDSGCPWDLKQNYQSIAPSTLEEAYEVVDALESNDRDQLREELGDLLFQVIFYSQLAKEEGAFEFTDIIDQLTQKLIRRHPHVFPDGTLESVRSSKDRGLQVEQEVKVKASWEKIKHKERLQKGKQGVFDDIPKALPALTRASKIQKRLVHNNMQAVSIEDVFPQCLEKLNDLAQNDIQHGSSPTQGLSKDQAEGLIGDILFHCVGIARHYGIDPEQSLRKTNAKMSII